MSLKGIIQRLQRKLMPERPPKRIFPSLAEGFERRAGQWQEVAVKPRTGARVGVLVTPWMSTAVPFFSLECALLLHSEGVAVSILWDSSMIFFNASTPSVVAGIVHVLCM